MADSYTERKKKGKQYKDADYEARKQRAFAEGVKTLFVTCALCGRNRPMHDRWGKNAEFIVKPDYFLIQARYSYGRGSGFFLKDDESLSVDQVKKEYPEIYDNIKKSVQELAKIFK